MEIEDLTDTRSQLSEFEKYLDQFTTDTDSLSPDSEDADGDKWNDAISYYFDKIKTTRNTLAQLITECRRNLACENQEGEIQREHKRSKLTKCLPITTLKKGILGTCYFSQVSRPRVQCF